MSIPSCPVFRKLCAREQLALRRESLRLLPGLLRQGLEPGDALALSHNAALLYRALVLEEPLRAPGDVLDRFSLGEIAQLCELFHRVDRGELEYGEVAE